MNRHRTFLCLTNLLVLACLTRPVGAEITLDVKLESFANLQVFFLEDLNISGQQASPEVTFRATITSDQTYDGARFVFSMRNLQTEIIHGESDPFTLDAGVTQITNLDLTEENAPYELAEYDISSEGEDVQDKLLQTGYFPSDTYILRLELHVPGEPIAADEVSITITNPFDIYLIAPLGTPQSPALLAMTTPLFTWASSATQFLLKICEKTYEGMDPESVMQGRPHYETPSSSPILGQSFSYPASGLRPLEPGRTYYWQVTSLVATSSGLIEYPSEIGAFTIQSQLDPDAQQILLVLQQILGPNYQDVMEQLSGFSPTGSIRLDGVVISIEELQDAAQQFQKGDYRTTEVNTE